MAWIWIVFNWKYHYKENGLSWGKGGPALEQPIFQTITLAKPVVALVTYLQQNRPFVFKSRLDGRVSLPILLVL